MSAHVGMKDKTALRFTVLYNTAKIAKSNRFNRTKQTREREILMAKGYSLTF